MQHCIALALHKYIALHVHTTTHSKKVKASTFNEKKHHETVIFAAQTCDHLHHSTNHKAATQDQVPFLPSFRLDFSLSLSFSLTRSFVVSVFKGEIISNEEDVNVLWCLIFKKDFIKNSLSVAWNQFLCVTATSIGDSFFKVLKKFTTEWKLYHAMIYGCGLLEHEKYCKQKFQNYFPSYI